MVKAPLVSVTGVIALVQESRFQLRDRGGAVHMFMLSPKAAIEPRQLKPLHDAGALVVIDYRDAAGLIARAAERVVLAADAA